MLWHLTGLALPSGRELPDRKGVLVCVLAKDASEWSIAVAQNTDIAPHRCESTQVIGASSGASRAFGFARSAETRSRRPSRERLSYMTAARPSCEGDDGQVGEHVCRDLS